MDQDSAMDAEAIFAASASQRLELADLLENLSPDQLATQSLCGQWDVATVGAHLGAAITTKIPAFALTLLRHGMSFDRANDATARNAAKRGVPVTIRTIRDNATSRFVPPGTGPRAPLTDVVVHTGDIARPLGLPHDAPAATVRTMLEFLSGPRTIGFIARGSTSGLAFVAEDVSMTIGTGEELHGRGIDLAMAMCGRTHALADLSGPGVEVLQGRLAH
jgi:uncharacterized protein (TIGR03083 family)